MSLRSSFDVRHPFFRPLWRRAAFFGVIVVWACYEAYAGNSVWALVFGAAGAYLGYEFFIAFDPKNYSSASDDEDS